MKSRRLERGLTQKESARSCGLSPDRWSELERGRRVPNNHELTNVIKFLGLGPVFVPPGGVTKTLLANGARMTAPQKPFFVGQDRASQIRYHACLERHRALTLSLTNKIMQRTDSRVCQEFCNQLRLDSYLECLYLLYRLAGGAIPGLVSPSYFAPTPLPIVDPTTRKYVGARPHLCLLEGNDCEFFQVSFLLKRTHRVDLLRWEGFWSVIELDGRGHDPQPDLTREAAIGLKTNRLQTEDVLTLAWKVCRRVA